MGSTCHRGQRQNALEDREYAICISSLLTYKMNVSFALPVGERFLMHSAFRQCKKHMHTQVHYELGLRITIHAFTVPIFCCGCGPATAASAHNFTLSVM
jgi:hypothetical protein